MIIWNDRGTVDPHTTYTIRRKWNGSGTIADQMMHDQRALVKGFTQGGTMDKLIDRMALYYGWHTEKAGQMFDPCEGVELPRETSQVANLHAEWVHLTTELENPESKEE